MKPSFQELVTQPSSYPVEIGLRVQQLLDMTDEEVVEAARRVEAGSW